jgi:hypothetical protein
MTDRPLTESRFRFQLPHWLKAHLVPFSPRNRAFMQGIEMKGIFSVCRRAERPFGGRHLSNPLDSVSQLEIGGFRHKCLLLLLPCPSNGSALFESDYGWPHTLVWIRIRSVFPFEGSTPEISQLCDTSVLECLRSYSSQGEGPIVVLGDPSTGEIN